MDEMLKLNEELQSISKKYNVTIMVAQQPKRKFSGYSREIKLCSADGRQTKPIIVDHYDIIKHR